MYMCNANANALHVEVVCPHTIRTQIPYNAVTYSVETGYQQVSDTPTFSQIWGQMSIYLFSEYGPCTAGAIWNLHNNITILNI